MIGQMLGHYRVEAQLGAGGMGVVYRAYDTRLDRAVAIKLLRAPQADDQIHSRLLGEARSASALNHPNICTIHEVEEANGQTFIVMEYVAGRLLSEVIPGGGLPVETVLQYGTQIADALGHAHEHGLVHRDLKSTNVMITPEGRAKVLDFGLAARMGPVELAQTTESGQMLAEAGSIGGTLPYMAPELLRGEPADTRSEIWGLGVVLYEMASGRLPFNGQTGFELSSAILRETPAPLAVRIPTSVRGIIRRCLAKEPRQRYQRALEVRAALEAIQAAEAVGAAPAPRLREGTRRWLLGVAGTVAALALGFLVLNVGSWRDRARGVTAGRIESLAVLPLENLSRDPEQDYFADGMTEALITDLSKIRALRVISRTSAMQYKGVNKPLQEIARELRVDAVVEGSVIRSGDRVRISAQLIEVATEQHLWAESYDRNLSDVLALQSEVARAIVDEIRIKVTPEEQARLATVRPVNPAAHEAYLRGRHSWNKRTEDRVRKGIDYFTQAIEKDDQFALAYVGLAESYLVVHNFGTVSARDVVPKAREAAMRALELDSGLAEAHAALGWTNLLLEWNWIGAESEFRRAVELDPANATAHHWYAIYLAARGRFPEAVATMKRAQEIDPVSLIINAELGWIFYFARQYGDVVSQCHQTLDIDPNFGVAHWILGLAYQQQGMYLEAIAEFQKAMDPSGSSWLALPALGHAFAGSGRRNEARKVLDKLTELSRQRYISPYDIALLHVGLGEKDAAFSWLQKAIEDRSLWLVWVKVEPMLDPLRSDRRFRDLLQSMGLVG